MYTIRKNWKLDDYYYFITVIIKDGSGSYLEENKEQPHENTYGPGSSSGKALGYGLDGPGSIPGVGRFSSLVRVQTGPEVHSASYKMSTGGFPRG